MTNRLKIYWIVWSILVFIATAGAIIDSLLGSITVPIQLKENSSINVSVFRPFPESLSISLRFDNIDGEDRSVLGGSRTEKGDWHKTGYINFREPGEPILLQIRDDTGTTIYEAEPAGGVELSTTAWRDLVPYINDGNPNMFVWPPRNDLRNKLHSGITKLNISVLQVGSNISGEVASLIVESPVSFKSCSSNYVWLWWFMFWPVYAVILFFYGLMLVGVTKRLKDYQT